MLISELPDIKTLYMWVADSHLASRDERAERWRDEEMYDGKQWSTEDEEKAQDSGIDPLTINRTFPTINLILGTQAINKFNFFTKGRTQDDSEISQIMSEAIKFVNDQNDGEFAINAAFRHAVIPGFGCLFAGYNPDPRKERVWIEQRPWIEMWWDPFASPWFEPNKCRYVFQQRWVDLSDLQAMFSEKRQELENQFQELSGQVKEKADSFYLDEASEVEEWKRMLTATDWVESKRKRVRPVEMWYAVDEKVWFALFPDGRFIELDDNRYSVRDQFAIIQQAQEVVSAIVKRIRVHTFLGDLSLEEKPSPFPHDQYPFIPFIGYLDRYSYPYGVPRQLRDMDEEVNKRRSMALALLRSRRVIAEKGVTKAGEEGMDALWEEANKLNGFLVVEEGAIKKIEIKEQAELAPSQVALLEQSEREIQDTGPGSNPEQMGQEGQTVSGKAIQERKAAGAVLGAPLFNNQCRSMKILGNQTISLIQGSWTGQKILRITDRLTGAERFVAINEPAISESGEFYFKNNITQGRYDLVVSEAPQTDTIREQNLNLIIEWVKKSPPEVIPHLMNLAFELSNLPNKEQLLARIKPILGVSPEDEDRSPEEVKADTIEQLEAQKEQVEEEQETQRAAVELELEGKALENEKRKAEIIKILVDAGKTIADAEREVEQMSLNVQKEMAAVDKQETDKKKPTKPEARA